MNLTFLIKQMLEENGVFPEPNNMIGDIEWSLDTLIKTTSKDVPKFAGLTPGTEDIGNPDNLCLGLLDNKYFGYADMTGFWYTKPKDDTLYLADWGNKLLQESFRPFEIAVIQTTDARSKILSQRIRIHHNKIRNLIDLAHATRLFVIDEHDLSPESLSKAIENK